MVFADLPYRRERAAPCFDESHPEELERYFLDLEVLFATHNIVLDAERKKAAVRYAKAVRTEKLWRSTPAFSDATRTYNAFKAGVFRMYPEVSVDHTYTN